MGGEGEGVRVNGKMGVQYCPHEDWPSRTPPRSDKTLQSSGVDGTRREGEGVAATWEDWTVEHLAGAAAGTAAPAAPGAGAGAGHAHDHAACCPAENARTHHSTHLGSNTAATCCQLLICTFCGPGINK